MIKKLKRSFTLITLLSLTAAMVLAVAVVNFSNWLSVRRELLSTVELIAETAREERQIQEMNAGLPGLPGLQDPGLADPAEDGSTPPPFPEDEPETTFRPDRGGFGRRGDLFWARERLQQDRHARNLVNESRWFSVLSDAEGNLTLADSDLLAEQLPDLDEDACLALAARAVASGKSAAFLGDYVFRALTVNDGTLLVFMSCETRLAAVRTLLLISGLACVAGILLAWLIAALASNRAIQPTLRNMERQKRFITDASHELKTPLTVISTNMELLQMESPGNPWVQSTQKQTASLRRLVDELVYLSRMEEENPTLSREPLQLSPLIREVAEPFQAMAEYNGSDFLVEAKDSLWINGDQDSIRRLISTLCDNAAKYAAPDGPIRVQASAAGKYARLTVSNPVAEPLTPEECAHLFDRFYRADPSRNKEKKSGFGIGLSIAAAVAENHGGSVSAAMEGSRRRAFTCLLPRISEPGPKK